MNTLALSIWLADAGWIPLVVIAVIWAITAAASSGSKKKKQPPTTRIPQKRPMAQKPPRLNNVQPPRKTLRPKKRPVMAPPPLPVETSVPTVSIAQAAPPAPPVSTRPTPSVASATAIHKWLNPQTLRQQFILTELLQEPIALRNG